MTLTSQSGAGKGEEEDSQPVPDSGTIPSEYESGLSFSTSTDGSDPTNPPPVSGVFDATPDNLASYEQSQPSTKPSSRQTAYSLFREQLKRYLKAQALSQNELARQIGLQPHVLSRKLHLGQGAFLTLPETRRLVLKLVELRTLNYQWQALELLQTLYPDQDFAREEWRSAPLNRLDTPRFKGGVGPGPASEPVAVEPGAGAGAGQITQPDEVTVEAVQDQPGEALVADTVAVGDAVIQPGEKRPKYQLGRGGIGVGSARRGIKSVGPGLDEGGIGGNNGEQHGSGGAGAAGWDDGSEAGTPGLLPLTIGVPLIGRDKELEQARNWLLDSASPVRGLTITGPGGVGKTSLALTLARQLLGSGQYSDGVVWVSLSTLPAGATQRELTEALARAVGLVLQAGIDPAEQIRNYLAGKRLVVVLDNYEQLQIANNNNFFLTRLLSFLPGLQLILTSRQVLKWLNGQVLKLAPLTYPRVGASLPPVVELAGKYSAVELFVRQARLLEPDFALTEGNAGVVVELCQRLDGVPLAIAIAAARVSQFGVAGVLDRINRHGALPMLEDEGQGEERHQSQAATIGWSYDLLTEEERRVWRGLAVFAGSVGIEAIERVLGEGLSAVEVDTRIVGGLVDKSMLFRVEDSMVAGAGAGSESRYYLHGVMREYALDRMRGQAGEEDKVREAHARYYLGLAEEVALKLNGSDRAGWQARLGIEYENVKAALGWLVEKSMVEEAYRLVGAMGQYWYGTRNYKEGREWLEKVMTLGEPSAEVKAEANNQLSRILAILERGKSERAVELARDSLAIWEGLEDKEGQVRALVNLGSAYYAGYQHDQAKEFYNQAFELAESANYRYGLAHAVTGLANIALVQGETEKAKKFYQRVIELRAEIGDLAAVAAAYRDLSLMALSEKSWNQAQIFTEKVFKFYEQLGNKIGTVELYLTLGRIAQAQGDIEEAKLQYKLGLERSAELSYTRFLPYFLFMISQLLSTEPLQTAKFLWLTQLCGAIEGLEVLDNHYFDESELALYNRMVNEASANLEIQLFRRNWKEGRTKARDLEAVVQLGVEALQWV